MSDFRGTPCYSLRQCAWHTYSCYQEICHFIKYISLEKYVPLSIFSFIFSRCHVYCLFHHKLLFSYLNSVVIFGSGVVFVRLCGFVGCSILFFIQLFLRSVKTASVKVELWFHELFQKHLQNTSTEGPNTKYLVWACVCIMYVWYNFCFSYFTLK